MSGTVPAAVTFNYATWSARYPEFSSVNQATAQEYFNEATIYIDNTGAGVVSDLNRLAVILNMATAHIAKMATAQLVGRIANASEGSVSVATVYAEPAGTRAWWDQTIYGAAAWQAMAPYRTMRYVLPPLCRPWGRC